MEYIFRSLPASHLSDEALTSNQQITNGLAKSEATPLRRIVPTEAWNLPLLKFVELENVVSGRLGKFGFFLFD
jgi:hypothetical protein